MQHLSCKDDAQRTRHATDVLHYRMNLVTIDAITALSPNIKCERKTGHNENRQKLVPSVWYQDVCETVEQITYGKKWQS